MSNETRDTLELFRQQGFDMSRPMKIEFFLALPDEEAGKRIIDQIESEGFSVSLESDSETGKWTCYCSKDLVPAYSAIIEIESRLDEIAKGAGGFADGFGSYGNSMSE